MGPILDFRQGLGVGGLGVMGGARSPKELQVCYTELGNIAKLEQKQKNQFQISLSLGPQGSGALMVLIGNLKTLNPKP